MNNFSYGRATSLENALDQAQADPNALYIAGGTNVVDRLKVFLDQPSQLIDISRLDLKQIKSTPAGGLEIGALVSNTSLADHPIVRQNYPMLSRAILAGASQQIRNMATVGGNMMQRTRCSYYYDPAFPCNKREPSTDCAAAKGINRGHALLGASDHCVAVHPSDMCVALAALDATVELIGAQGQRQLPFGDFHRLPDTTPHQDTNLRPGELIKTITLPPAPFAESGVYLKLRDRTSYAFALVSVAAALVTANGRITEARLALGGMAHKPWRASTAEQVLIGQSPTEDQFQRAAEVALQDAKPLAHNGYKVELAKRAITRALTISAQGGGIA